MTLALSPMAILRFHKSVLGPLEGIPVDHAATELGTRRECQRGAQSECDGSDATTHACIQISSDIRQGRCHIRHDVWQSSARYPDCTTLVDVAQSRSRDRVDNTRSLQWVGVGDRAILESPESRRLVAAIV